MTLRTWAWCFFALYVVGMIGVGVWSRRRVTDADQYATARASYGPLVLALAFAATTASGGTFLGFPGLAYEHGAAALWSSLFYPLGLFVGVWVCIGLVGRAGERFGSRSIPEYLGDRYLSDGLRLLVALLSLLLFFYLAGQLVAGLVMFETFLGLSQAEALVATTLVILLYVVIGGAHADIVTDGVQGALMLAIAALVLALFVLGVGLGGSGGAAAILDAVAEQDSDLVRAINPQSALYGSPWALFAFLAAHVPMGLLPHVGNKIWALERARDRRRFALLVLAVALLMGLLGLAGLSARGLFGGELLAAGRSSNEALPLLVGELLPPWLAAMVGVAVLAAVMSTADGLVVSSSQVFANDLYRRTLVPRYWPRLSPAAIEARALAISRLATVGSLLVCAAMAWALAGRNVALLVWAGSGGLMAAFAGPLVLGALWRGVTRAGAWAGVVGGIVTFVVLHAGWIDGDGGVLGFLAAQAPNPFACATLGEGVSVALTAVVSWVSAPLPEEHLRALFAADE